MSILISLAATQHWPFHQLDVKNAFLNSVLDEEDYMKQPPGFIAQEESGKVCRLKKSLYELKQSPRAWFGQFASVIRSFSFSKRSLYILSTASRKEVTSYSGCGRYDIIIIDDDAQGITYLKYYLQKL